MCIRDRVTPLIRALIGRNISFNKVENESGLSLFPDEGGGNVFRISAYGILPLCHPFKVTGYGFRGYAVIKADQGYNFMAETEILFLCLIADKGIYSLYGTAVDRFRSAPIAVGYFLSLKVQRDS